MAKISFEETIKALEALEEGESLLYAFAFYEYREYTFREVKKRYHRMALHMHPDKSSIQYEHLFKKLKRAFELAEIECEKSSVLTFQIPFSFSTTAQEELQREAEHSFQENVEREECMKKAEEARKRFEQNAKKRQDEANARKKQEEEARKRRWQEAANLEEFDDLEAKRQRADENPIIDLCDSIPTSPSAPAASDEQPASTPPEQPTSEPTTSQQPAPCDSIPTSPSASQQPAPSKEQPRTPPQRSTSASPSNSPSAHATCEQPAPMPSDEQPRTPPSAPPDEHRASDEQPCPPTTPSPPPSLRREQRRAAFLSDMSVRPIVKVEEDLDELRLNGHVWGKATMSFDTYVNESSTRHDMKMSFDCLVKYGRTNVDAQWLKFVVAHKTWYVIPDSISL